MCCKNRKISLFLVLIIIVCTPCYILMARGSQKLFYPLVFIIMWTPGISALLVKLVTERNLRGFGWKPGKLSYLGLSYMLPLLGGLIVYGFVWISGIGTLTLERFGNDAFLHILKAATLGMLVSLGTAAGEEIGWRGFLLPELLNKKSAVKTALIISAVWAVYHYPGILFSRYNSGTESWYAVLFFTLQIIGLTFIMTWLRIQSGSLWPAVILHASHNLFIQAVFDRLTIDLGTSLYITGDFGAGMALFYGAAGIILWRMMRRPAARI